uniref:Uncharacterized protein n=1 Tax=Acrobeloides nanus TaxID=290746 RepID=A0A914CBX3_9BILA
MQQEATLVYTSIQNQCDGPSAFQRLRMALFSACPLFTELQNLSTSSSIPVTASTPCTITVTFISNRCSAILSCLTTGNVVGWNNPIVRDNCLIIQ